MRDGAEGSWERSRPSGWCRKGKIEWSNGNGCHLYAGCGSHRYPARGAWILEFETSDVIAPVIEAAGRAESPKLNKSRLVSDSEYERIGT